MDALDEQVRSIFYFIAEGTAVGCSMFEISLGHSQLIRALFVYHSIPKIAGGVVHGVFVKGLPLLFRQLVAEMATDIEIGHVKNDKA
jgi:hypothetical protein